MDFGSQAILKANCFLNRRQLTWKIVSYILYDVNFTFICRVDILIDDLNWVNMKPWAIFRYKRRTNVMCTTLLCSRGLPRPSRPCGPDTASRSPGAPSCTRTSRWVMMGSGWLLEDDWVSTHQVHPSGQVIRKGVLPDIDSYSAFFDNSKLSKTALEEIIKKELVSDIYVCGIATDVCVGKKCFCDTENVPPVHFFTLAINKMHEISLEDMKRPRLKAT